MNSSAAQCKNKFANINFPQSPTNDRLETVTKPQIPIIFERFRGFCQSLLLQMNLSWKIMQSTTTTTFDQHQPWDFV